MLLYLTHYLYPLFGFSEILTNMYNVLCENKSLKKCNCCINLRENNMADCESIPLPISYKVMSGQNYK